MAELARRFIGHPDAEQLFPGGFGRPCYCYGCGFRGRNHNVVLGVVAEDGVGVDGESVFALLDAGNGDFARGGGDVGPVLVCGCVEDVVLEVAPVFRENGNGLLGAGGKLDACFEGAAARGRDEIGHMLCDGVVEGGVPVWSEAVLLCVFAELLERAARVEVEILRPKRAVEAVGDVGRLVAMVVGHYVVVHDAIYDEV